ncbi:MAG: VacJ family lipoprotein [Burkholderiaceae bacterium]
MKRLCVVGLISIALSGCTTIQNARGGPGQRLDPWEKWNRKVFNFNEDLDAKILKPVATVYSNVVPQPVRNGIGNFFGNAADAWSAINNVLQGKFELGVQDATRFGVNTVFGIFGIVDIATEMGLDHQYEDFGQTLGHYGVGAGAYMVLPLFGPSTVRETAVLPLERAVSPALVINDGGTQWGITALQLVNKRASLLGASRVIEGIALDKYSFVRDAYLQRRRSLVRDGEEEPIIADTPDAAASGAASATPAASAAAAVVALPAPAPSAPAASAPAAGASGGRTK